WSESDGRAIVGRPAAARVPPPGEDSPHGGTHLEVFRPRCPDAGGLMRTAQPVVELDQIEREYAAVIALLDRSAAFRHAAALVPGEVNLDVGFAAERIDDLDTLELCAVSGNRTDALLDLLIPARMRLSGHVATLPPPTV